MKRYGLLVDWEVVVRLREMAPRVQRAVYAVFARLQEAPDAISEFTAVDEKGRDLEVFIVAGFAFYYWIDFADRHVKVLAVGKADDPSR